MKEAADFTRSSLVEIPAGLLFAGKLATTPSTSPENVYLLDGKSSSLTYAPTMYLELIGELFENTRAAARIMGKDADFIAKMQSIQKRLPPAQVGPQGQLQEWIQDFQETDPHHRHMSHLYSLYPGHDIDLERTPAMAAAARRSMEPRGGGSTGWSDVWRVGLWARLHNAQGAYTNLKLLMTRMTLPNMFDLCPPFQIDGNLGGPGRHHGDACAKHTGLDHAVAGTPVTMGRRQSEGRMCPWRREGRHCLGWGKAQRVPAAIKP